MDKFGSTELRILEATREVLRRNGYRKLSMWDVAVEAGVSRPTLYRWFPSKEELLNAFGLYEQHRYDEGVAAAVAGLTGLDALNAALEFTAEYQQTYSLTPMSDIEPEHVLSQITRTFPVMRRRLAALIPDENRDVIAATIVRVAVCHYLIDGDDKGQLLEQLRCAAGIVVV